MTIPHIRFTQEGYQKIEKDILKLQEERKEAVVNLRTAREMGDLSENGAYKAARFELGGIDRQLRRLKYLLRFGTVAQITNKGCIDFGSLVTLSDGKNELTFTLVGEYESNPAQKKLSVSSPIGKAIMGKRTGDTVTVNTPTGTINYTIVNFESLGGGELR
ncbi:transcription elongation factor GreA [Candidatus Microgenomates bacterium]|nr:transcription elongation factor GreA [Candidatus Microgenomates bacterium]